MVAEHPDDFRVFCADGETSCVGCGELLVDRYSTVDLYTAIEEHQALANNRKEQE